MTRNATYFYAALRDKGFLPNEAEELSKELHSKYIKKETMLVDALLKFAWIQNYQQECK